MSESLCGRQKKAISAIFIKGNSPCKSIGPSEQDRMASSLYVMGFKQSSGGS